jgi:hypothetical protein
MRSDDPPSPPSEGHCAFNIPYSKLCAQSRHDLRGCNPEGRVCRTQFSERTLDESGDNQNSNVVPGNCVTVSFE